MVIMLEGRLRERESKITRNLLESQKIRGIEKKGEKVAFKCSGYKKKKKKKKKNNVKMFSFCSLVYTLLNHFSSIILPGKEEKKKKKKNPLPTHLIEKKILSIC